MRRQLMMLVVTTVLLSVLLATAPSRAGEWSSEYRGVLARTAAKRKAHRARLRWIRPINQAVFATINYEVLTYPYRLQQRILAEQMYHSGSLTGVSAYSAGTSGGGRGRDDDDGIDGK